MITLAEVLSVGTHLKDVFDMSDDLEIAYRLTDGELRFVDYEAGNGIDGPALAIKVERRTDEEYTVAVNVTVEGRTRQAYEGYGTTLEAGPILESVQSELATMGVVA